MDEEGGAGVGSGAEKIVLVTYRDGLAAFSISAQLHMAYIMPFIFYAFDNLARYPYYEIFC